MKPAHLVKGDDPERLVPLRTGPERLVNVLDELLHVRYAARWVHRVGAVTTAGRVDVGEMWERAAPGRRRKSHP